MLSAGNYRQKHEDNFELRTSIVIIVNSCKRAKMRTRGEAWTSNTFLGNLIRNLKGSVK